MEYFITSLYAFYDDWGETTQYLIGMTSPLSPNNQLYTIGCVMGVTALLLSILYPVIHIKRISKAKLWVSYIIIGVLAYFIAYLWLLIDYYNGKMVTLDCETNLMIPLTIENSQFIDFGVNNVIITLTFYSILLLMVKSILYIWQLIQVANK